MVTSESSHLNRTFTAPPVRKTYLVKVNWTYGRFDFEVPTRSAADKLVDEIFDTRRFHSVDEEGVETIVPLYQINFIRIVPPGGEEEEDESEVTE